MVKDRAARAAVGILLMLAALAFAMPAAAGQNQSDLDSGETNAGVQELYLYMDEEDLEELYTRDPDSEERLNGSVRLFPDGEDIELDGLRFRGTSSRELPKRSFNIRFIEPQPFLFGSTTVNLKATYTDPTMMRESISMDLFHALDQPAPRTKYFDLYINGIYEGLYIHVERVDEGLLESNGLNPRGTLIADDFRGNLDRPDVNRLSVFGFDIDNVTDPETFLEETMDIRGEAELGAFRDLVSWVYNTPAGPEFEEGFYERFDEENFIDWLAIHIIIGDVDSYSDDYWLYLDTDDPDAEWMIIPWDKDLTFGSHTRRLSTVNDYFGYEFTLENIWQNELVGKFLETPALRERLNLRMEHLMTEEFTEEYYAEQIRAHEELIGDRLNITPGEDAFVLHPQNHHGELGNLPYHTEAILDFVQLRHQFLERNITPVSGDPYTASENITVDLEGSIVYFTDPDGWVIASLEVARVADPGTIAVEVSELPENPGIDRRWAFDTGDADISGELTLYYRNDVESCCLPAENWFISTAAVRSSIYSQWDLVLAEEGEDGGLIPMETYINPYSNKASADVTLEGAQGFLLVLPNRVERA
jgi:spore coat protein H